MAEPFVFVPLVLGYKRQSQVSGDTGGGVWRTGIGINAISASRLFPGPALVHHQIHH
jgi:hypothetical protein